MSSLSYHHHTTKVGSEESQAFPCGSPVTPVVEPLSAEALQIRRRRRRDRVELARPSRTSVSGNAASDGAFHLASLRLGLLYLICPQVRFQRLQIARKPAISCVAAQQHP